MTSRAWTIGSVVLVCAALLVVVFVWQDSAPERNGESGSSTSSSNSSDRDATSLASDALAETDREGRAAARVAALADEDGALRVVSMSDGTLVPGARVRCLASTGARADITAHNGSLVLPVPLPAALEVSAAGHATRWVLVRAHDANEIALWPAATLVVTAVDEASRPIGDVTFAIEREAQEPTVARAFESVFDATKAGESDATWLPAFDAMDGDVRATWFAPLPAHSVGPRVASRRHETPNDGRVRLDGLPAGEWWRVIDARPSLVRFEPPHTPDPHETDPRRAAATSLSGWVRTEAEREAHIVLVRHGTCVVRFAFDVASERRVSKVEIVRYDIRPLETTGADPTLVAFGLDAPSINWPGSPTGVDDPRGSYVVERGGFRAGPHRLTAEWRLNLGPDEERQFEHVERRFAARQFILVEGEYLDLGLLSADPGRLEIAIAAVDERGVPLGAELDLRHVYRDEHGALAESANELRLDVELELEGLLYFESEFLDLSSGHARLDILGLPNRDGAVRVRPIHMTGKPPSNLLLEQSTEVSFQGAVFQRVDVALRASRARRIEFALLVEGRRCTAAPLESQSQIATVEAEPRDVAIEWSTRDGHSVGAAIVPFGAARAAFAFRDAPSATSDEVSPADLGAWYFVDATFDVDAASVDILLFEATRAARATLVSARARDMNSIEKAAWQFRYSTETGDRWFELGWLGGGRTESSDRLRFHVDGLPTNALIRAAALGLEFRTGPPGSTVDVVLPEER